MQVVHVSEIPDLLDVLMMERHTVSLHFPTLPKTMKETYVISKAVYCEKAVI